MFSLKMHLLQPDLLSSILFEFKADEWNRRTNELEGGIVVFGDMLEYNQKALHPFFTRCRYKDLAV